jgi:hypothetical protein
VTAEQSNPPVYPPVYPRTPNDSSELCRYFNAKAAGLNRKSPKPPPLYTDKNPRLWTGTRLEAIGPAYRCSVLQETRDGYYLANPPAPSRGWSAYFVELTFPSRGPFPFKFTTGVRIAPEILPFGPPPELTRRV